MASHQIRPEGIGLSVLTFAQLEQYANIVNHIDHRLRLPAPSWRESYESLVFWMNERDHFVSGRMVPRHDFDMHRLCQL